MKKNTITCILLIGFFLLAAFFIARSLNFYQNDGSDFFSLWLAPHLLLQGQDPYTPEVWIPAHDVYGAGWISDRTFLYPLPLAVLLIPIGIFPLNAAAILWVLLTLAVCIFIVWRFLHSFTQNRLLPYLLPALAGIFLFRPTFLTLLVGQIEILLLLCLVGTVWLWETGNWACGGIFLALVLLKPQIGAPLVALWSLWLVLQRRWNGLMGIGIGATGLFSLGLIFDPGWLFRWIAIGQDKVSGVFGYSPTVWGVSASICGHQNPCANLLGVAFAIIVFAMGVWVFLRQKTRDPMTVLPIIITLTLCVTPYLWAYTQVLLIVPILILMKRMHQRKTPYLLTATFPILMAMLAFVFLFIAVAIGSDVWSVFVPVIPLFLLGLLP